MNNKEMLKEFVDFAFIDMTIDGETYINEIVMDLITWKVKLDFKT